jgi:secreted PhoX family phosphatase
VWFGTDSYFGVSGRKSADGLYYLDLDPAHKTTPTPTYGLAFRVAAVPSDAEATAPTFSPGMSTLFFNVQHPGEDVQSSWPPR